MSIDRPRTGCIHCGSAIPQGSAAPAGFCCSGCEAVHRLLVENGLARFYELSPGQVLPVADAQGTRGDAWLEPLLAQAQRGDGQVCSLELDVQGVHCAACVWLMNELFRRRPGGAAFLLNPALGKASVSWHRGRFDLPAFVREVERFGYLFGPSRKHPLRASRELVVRLGVCLAATGNVMLFSAAFYFGLSPADPEAFRLFTRLSLLLATTVVLVGGWPFLKAAALGLRRGVLHLDLPIALGIGLAYAMALVQAQQGRGEQAYLDSLCAFVTLMLVGRWLQQRVLEQNRRFLLEDGGAMGIFVRRREGASVRVVPAPKIRAGDALVVAPGDLLPVDATLAGEGSFSLDWISGEPLVHRFAAGARAPAGAFNAGRAVEARAEQAFADSALPALLEACPPSQGGGAPPHARFFDRLARWYSIAVLALAAAGFGLWLPEGLPRATDVAAALLVVTCPCALGVALPLAAELVHARLRRAGVLVRSGDLLDRVQRVRKVIFDKTGTLTLGRLELANPEAVRALEPALRDAAYELALRSNHPVSRCLAAALSAAGARSLEGAQVDEVPGRGLSLVRDGRCYRLGAPGWAAALSAGSGTTVLSVDGAPVARFALREAVRAGAHRELEALRAAGLEVWLLSGDEPARVAAFARDLGVAPERALGGRSPQDKAATVRALDARDTLFLGDGVNDGPAFAAALCAGTPAVDRPVIPGRADFFLLGEDLSALSLLFAAARDLRAARGSILAFALAYNAVAVVAALAGTVTPLLAAVAMPASSLGILLWTAARLGGARSAAREFVPALQEAVP